MRAIAISVDSAGLRAIAPALRSSSTSTMAPPPGCGLTRSILCTRAHTVSSVAHALRIAAPVNHVASGLRDVAAAGPDDDGAARDQPAAHLNRALVHPVVRRCDRAETSRRAHQRADRKRGDLRLRPVGDELVGANEA